MTEEELIAKMYELGLLLHDMEEAQVEFDAQHMKLTKRIEDLKDELRPEFLKRKESMKSNTLEVVYRKPAVKWETKWLDGYSVAHPEIRQYRKEGQPTVAFKCREEHDDDGR